MSFFRTTIGQMKDGELFFSDVKGDDKGVFLFVPISFRVANRLKLMSESFL